jgi:hypothetical protein
VQRVGLARSDVPHALTQVAALENQLASSIYAASGSSSKASAGSPFAVPVLGEGGGLLRRSLDSGVKTKTTLRLEEDGGFRSGIVQRQLPSPFAFRHFPNPLFSLQHLLCPFADNLHRAANIDQQTHALAEANRRVKALEQVAMR